MNDFVRKENRKALPKFLGTTILCGIGGGVLGFLGVAAGHLNTAEVLQTWMEGAMKAVLPYGIAIATAIFALPGFFLYYGAKKRFNAWDGEEETMADEAEKMLSYALLLSAVLVILDFFFLSAGVVYGTNIWNVAAFLVSCALAMVMQQKVVDLTRRFNPEKRGSVYDLQFQKKWMDSCDEAEQRQIGQACYKAFLRMTSCCLVLFVGLLILNYIFSFGLLPMVVPLAILCVGQISYTIECIRLQGRRSEKEV